MIRRHGIYLFLSLLFASRFFPLIHPTTHAVTDGDLTRGYFVAGTGTIAADGTVGPVGGAAEKALAAEHDGAQIFLVPKDNADEARRWEHNLQIVPVDRFEDAVRFLCSLEPRADSLASPVQPTPCAGS